MSVKEIKGRDLAATVKYITIDGERKKMVFSNYTYFLVENLYEDEFGKSLGFEKILKEAADGKIRGFLALTYCALQAGGSELPDFKTWMNGFDLTAMQTIGASVLEGVTDSMPEPEKNAEGTAAGA